MATYPSTICVPGWQEQVRPPSRYTSKLKRRQIRQYGYEDRHLSPYEEDHLPIDIGGLPNDPLNLWPEPRDPPDGWTVKLNDELEKRLRKLVCSGQVSLAEAQQAIATDWHAAYRRCPYSEDDDGLTEAAGAIGADALLKPLTQANRAKKKGGARSAAKFREETSKKQLRPRALLRRTK